MIFGSAIFFLLRFNFSYRWHSLHTFLFKTKINYTLCVMALVWTCRENPSESEKTRCVAFCQLLFFNIRVIRTLPVISVRTHTFNLQIFFSFPIISECPIVFHINTLMFQSKSIRTHTHKRTYLNASKMRAIRFESAAVTVP